MDRASNDLGVNKAGGSRTAGREVGLGRWLAALWLVLALGLALPSVAAAQAGGATPIAQPQATPANQQAPAPGASTAPQRSAAPQPAAPVVQPAGGPAATAPAAGLVPGIATPVGSNVPVEKPEPMSLFAYLLIVLAGLWVLAAIVGLLRLASQPRYRGLGGSYYPGYGPESMPEQEKSRGFLSFAMPFLAIVCVAVVVIVWGEVFLTVASNVAEYATLGVDVAVILLVMLIATILARRGGAGNRSALH